MLAALSAGCGAGESSSPAEPSSPTPAERGRASPATGPETSERKSLRERESRSPRVRRFAARASTSCLRARRRAGPVDPRSPVELRRWAVGAARVVDRRNERLSRLKAPARPRAFEGFLDAAGVTSGILERVRRLPAGTRPEAVSGLARLLVRHEREVEHRARGLGIRGCGALAR